MNMKLFAAAAAVACTMVAVPAFAQDINVSAGYVRAKPFTPGHIDGYQAAASFSTAPASGSWGFQGGASVLDGSGIADPLITVEGVAFKQNDTNRWGGYLVYTDVGFSGFEGGLVGQLLNEHYTLTATAGYGSLDVSPSVQYTNVAGAATFYLTETISLTGTVGFANFDSAAGSQTQTGVQAEYKPKGLPVSIYAGYDNYNFSGTGTTSLTSVGLKFNFGNKGLKERDQKGTLNTSYRYRGL